MPGSPQPAPSSITLKPEIEPAPEIDSALEIELALEMESASKADPAPKIAPAPETDPALEIGSAPEIDSAPEIAGPIFSSFAASIQAPGQTFEAVELGSTYGAGHSTNEKGKGGWDQREKSG